MTLAVETPITAYNTDGVTLSYPLGFTVSENSDVTAQLTDALGNVTTPGFSVSGGNAVLNILPAAGGTLLLIRSTPIDQLADFVSGDSFASGVADAAFDRTVRILQELALQLRGTLRGPDGEVNMVLPPASARAGMFLAFDVNGNPILQPATNLNPSSTILES